MAICVNGNTIQSYCQCLIDNNYLARDGSCSNVDPVEETIPCKSHADCVLGRSYSGPKRNKSDFPWNTYASPATLPTSIFLSESDTFIPISQQISAPTDLIPMQINFTSITASLVLFIMAVFLIIILVIWNRLWWKRRPEGIEESSILRASDILLENLGQNDDTYTNHTPLGTVHSPGVSLNSILPAELMENLRTSTTSACSNKTCTPNQGTSSTNELIGDLLNSKCTTKLPKNSIKGLKLVGEGYYGQVFKAELHLEDDVETVAVKILKKTDNSEALKDFLEEAKIMSSFQHPNILTLMGVCPREGCTPPWIVCEYMEQGDLTEILRHNSPNNLHKENKPELPTLSAKDLLSIALQIAAGMKYLATRNFVHRDLASRNCLVGSGLIVKISDFGMSRDVHACDYYKIENSRMLPVRWMSPECLTYLKFTLESDVWSYGVLLWEIYTFGKKPYFGHTNEEVLKLLSAAKPTLLDVPENCPPEVADIMKSCWELDTSKRITFSDICCRLAGYPI